MTDEIAKAAYDYYLNIGSLEKTAEAFGFCKASMLREFRRRGWERNRPGNPFGVNKVTKNPRVKLGKMRASPTFYAKPMSAKRVCVKCAVLEVLETQTHCAKCFAEIVNGGQLPKMIDLEDKDWNKERERELRIRAELDAKNPKKDDSEDL